MTAWRLRGDVLVFEHLRLRLHRIGLAHWHAGAVLRSWGAVALHRSGDALHAPCAAGEALWLGVWLDEEGVTAEVALIDPLTARRAAIAPPGGFQIAGLCGDDAALHPLVQTGAILGIQLRCGTASTAASLQLLAPAAWAALSGRPAPDPLTGPPPLPPRLG